MPIVHVQLLAGRPPETLEALGEALTTTIEQTLGASRETIRVVLSEVPATHWFKGGLSIASGSSGPKADMDPSQGVPPS